MADFTRDPPKEVQLPPRLPLVGVLNQRGATAERDSRLINGYVEQSLDGTLDIVKRPGLTLKYNIGGLRKGSGMFGEYSLWTQPVEGGYTVDFFTNSTETEANIIAEAGDTSTRVWFWGEVVPRLPAVGDTVTSLFFHCNTEIFTYDTADGLIQLNFAGTAYGPGTFGVTIGSTTVGAADVSNLSIYSSVTGTEIQANTTITSKFSPATPGPYTFQISLTATATNAAASLSFELAGPSGVGNAYWNVDRLAGGVVDLNTATYTISGGGVISTSDPDDAWAWDPLAVIDAYADQSETYGIAKSLTYIVALKAESIEFFRDAGVSPGSPLARVENMQMDIGCYSERAFTTVDGVLLWVSNTKSGLRSVWMMESARPVEVATPAIRRALEGMAPEFVFGFSVCGHTFFVITDSEAEISLVYDKTSNFWSYWNALGENYFPFVASSYVAGEVRLQHISNGKIYTLDPDAVIDEGAAFDMDIYPPEYDANSRLSKYLSKMYVIADQEAGSQLLLRVNDDNQTAGQWSNFRVFDLSEARPRLDECGTFYKRSFHFRHSSPTRCRLKYVELDLQMGSL